MFLFANWCLSEIAMGVKRQNTYAPIIWQNRICCEGQSAEGIGKRTFVVGIS